MLPTTTLTPILYLDIDSLDVYISIRYLFFLRAVVGCNVVEGLSTLWQVIVSGMG
jgi:hypothetical protein